MEIYLLHIKLVFLDINHNYYKNYYQELKIKIKIYLFRQILNTKINFQERQLLYINLKLKIENMPQTELNLKH